MRDRVVRWIAWHLPKSVVYWCAIRVGTHASTGKFARTAYCDLTLMQALSAWDKK